MTTIMIIPLAVLVLACPPVFGNALNDWLPVGGFCLRDSVDERVFTWPKKVGEPQTIESYWFDGKKERASNSKAFCLKTCANDGYPVAGVEYGGECFCGTLSDVMTRGIQRGKLQPDENCQRDHASGQIYERDIGWLCPNTTIGEKCGGNELLQVVTLASFIPAEGLCFYDPLDNRVLEFPKKVEAPEVIESYWFDGKNGRASNSKAFCRSVCTTDGFPVYGVEYGGECFCGTYTMVMEASVRRQGVPMAQCDNGWLCPNTTTDERCGGNHLIHVYTDSLLLV